VTFEFSIDTHHTGNSLNTIHTHDRRQHRSFQSLNQELFCPHTINWLLCEGVKYRGQNDEHDHINRFALAIAGFMFNEPSLL
jgi:hypothetical protein